MSRKTYTASATRDESGWWVVLVPELPGVVTQARRLGQVDPLARDAIGLWLERPSDSFDVQLRVESPRGVQAAVARARESRQAADAAQLVALADTRAAVEQLTSEGLSMRDVGTLLGISHQRVQQILREDRPKARRPRRAAA